MRRDRPSRERWVRSNGFRMLLKCHDGCVVALVLLKWGLVIGIAAGRKQAKTGRTRRDKVYRSDEYLSFDLITGICDGGVLR